MSEWRTSFEEIEIGKGRLIREGEDVAILTIGHPGNMAIDACRMLVTDEVHPAHYDLRFVKPLDEELLHEVFSNFKKVITVEDGSVMGGFGSAVLEFMVDHGYHSQVKRLGIPDRVIEHGSQPELWKECGYDADAMADAVCQMMGVRVAVK